MRNSPSPAYLLLLVVAFAIGLCGTVAASRALAPVLSPQPAVGPASAPSAVPAPRLPTVEC